MLSRYGFDLTRWLSDMDRSPTLVLSLLEAIACDESSLLCASLRGGRQFIGFTEDRQLLMGVFDAINTNTVATGNFKKAPKIPEWPRPKKKQKVKPLSTVAGIRRHFGLPAKKG